MTRTAVIVGYAAAITGRTCRGVLAVRAATISLAIAVRPRQMEDLWIPRP
jgi:hypothetical protein